MDPVQRRSYLRVDSGRFVTRQNGRWLLTPLAMALIMIEATDVIFAVDSIPAIFGITRDPLIVYTSNVCAILGLRSLYFLLAGVVHKFVYLKPALAVILCFIGIKIVLTHICPIPTAVSLGIVGLILLSAIGLSLLLGPRRRSAAKPTPTPHSDTPRPRATRGQYPMNENRLSTDLEALHARIKDEPLTLAELNRELKARGSAVLLILLALPFCFVAIPGLSVPFGIAIGCIGVCIAIGREPWLPRFVMGRRLSGARVRQLLAAGIRVAHKLERLTRPRLTFLHAGPAMPRLIGLGIVIASLGLMLPLPIPFSNSIPAWAVVLLALGRMEQDGLLVLLGHLTVVATWVWIGLGGAVAVRTVQWLMDSLQLTAL
jgi:hypothetical protein